MSSSDEDEMGAIQRAQAVARARVAAQLPHEPAQESPAPEQDGGMFDNVFSNGTMAGSSGKNRKTCGKDKLAVKCRHCKDGTRKPCAYRAYEWDPPGNATTSEQQQQQVVNAFNESEQAAERRTRKATERFEPGDDFWRRELPEVAQRRANSSRAHEIGPMAAGAAGAAA